MTENLEELAAEQATITSPVPTPVDLMKCPLCKGSGRDPSARFSFLWGGACWGCSGWGQVRRGTFKLRGPSASHPSR